MKWNQFLAFIIIISCISVFPIVLITRYTGVILDGDNQYFSVHLKGQNLLNSVDRINRDIIPPFTYLQHTPMTKDLVVYSAYFDDRSRKGYNNITVFLISANRSIFNASLITGCGVGTTKARNFSVRYVQEDILMHNWLGINKFPYEQLIVECYDLALTTERRPFVMYKTHRHSSITLVVESDKPVMIPAPRKMPSGKHNFSIVVCTKAHNRKVSWLPEFLRYQKTLGVDHVHLTVLDTFIKDGGFHDYILEDHFSRTALHNGFLNFTVWKEWYDDSEIYVHGTILQYLDCIYRYRGTYDYVSLMDSDDFFTPRMPGKSSIKDYISEYCFKKSAGSCAFRWLYYYPEVCGMKGKVEEDGNVTAQLVPHTGVDVEKHLKSIHSTAALVDTSFHDATCDGCLLQGSNVVFVPPEIAYVAHNRMYNTKKEYLKVCRNMDDKPLTNPII